MNYYDLPQDKQDELEKAGVDYDLRACLEYNPQPFNILDIKKVLAVWVGENDGDDWRWIIQLTPQAKKEHKAGYVFLMGGCDYTGWDCQSWATSQLTKTAKQAVQLSLGDVQLGESQPFQAGLGHMINLIGGHYGDNFKQVYDSLMSQVSLSKKKTWHESKDEELNTKDIPKL